MSIYNLKKTKTSQIFIVLKMKLEVTTTKLPF